jgi:hypothetical protein
MEITWLEICKEYLAELVQASTYVSLHQFQLKQNEGCFIHTASLFYSGLCYLENWMESVRAVIGWLYQAMHNE